MKRLSLTQFLNISFLISIIAILGSLYFSEVVKLTPCSLCWYQRILIYPLPIMIIISMIVNDTKIVYYLRIFSFLGIILSTYHYLIQFFHKKSTFCNILSDCTSIDIQYFGFITIPFMSILAFLTIFSSSFLIKK
ncbi:disulfide bond formation protein B [Bacillus cereus]|nr:disulfide bond formation protein B [Bacillus cereus]